MSDIILYSTTFDLIIKNGDFVIANSDQQETSLLLETFKGNWFSSPLTGIGLLNYLAGAESAIFIEQQIKQGMIDDGFIVESISIKGSTLDNPQITILAKR